MQFSSIILALATSSLVAAHGAIVAATGDAGGAGQAIGVVNSTPRDGTRRNPFQADSTRFRGDAADTCGETVGAGTNDIVAGTAAMLAVPGNTMPVITPGGSVNMTLHQVNGDGAGPYTCEIDATGTGTAFQPMTVTANVPGKNSRSDAKATDFNLAATVPANQQCTGAMAGATGVCMVRCMNAARAGPFGGCVPVTMAAAGAAGAAGNATRRSVTFRG